MQEGIKQMVCATLLAPWIVAACVAGAFAATDAATNGQEQIAPVEMSLDVCVNTALERNHSRPASRFALAAAEAQHRQVMSAYWPQASLKGAYEIMDEPRNYIFPSSKFTLPYGGSIAVNIPGVGTVPASEITIPDQEIKLMDRESWYASLGVQWLLWDGGMRRGLKEQALAGVDVAREGLRRTELAIVDDVTRLYYGAVMARQIRQVGLDTLARMETTLNLTETMYKEGSGKVTKADYLDNKIMVETLRAAVAQLENNQEMAEAALAWTIGLEWNQSVRPSASDIPFEPLSANLQALVSDAYEFSPDWKSLEAGLRAGEGALRAAKSGHYPKVALTGDLHKWWNDYDKGMATDENKEGWTAGIGIELPLFQGFLTDGKVKEARARLGKLQEERILLREGLGLQVRGIVRGLNAAAKRYQATLDAMNASIESRDLNARAYQNELVETQDVIKSQLMESFMSAQHFKMRYDHAELRSRLNLVVGREVQRRLGGE